MTLLLPSAASISCGGNQQTGDFNHEREGLSQWKGENETICGVEALAKRHFRTLSLRTQSCHLPPLMRTLFAHSRGLLRSVPRSCHPSIPTGVRDQHSAISIQRDQRGKISTCALARNNRFGHLVQAVVLRECTPYSVRGSVKAAPRGKRSSAC